MGLPLAPHRTAQAREARACTGDGSIACRRGVACPQAALSEYMRAAIAAGVALPAYLQQLAVDVLLQQAQEHQASQAQGLHLLRPPGAGHGMALHCVRWRQPSML